MSTSHDHAVRSSRRHLRPLTLAFALVAGFMVVELVAGFWSGSLALISDAGHMATDALGLGMALAAVVAADKAGHGGSRTYGLYRTEILAALANAVLLFVVAGYVLVEAAERLRDPGDVLSLPMLVVGIGGLVVNVVAWQLLRRGADESLNVEGAYLEVVADLLGSVAVIVAAGLIWLTEWTIVDPIVGAAIAVFILPRAWSLAGKAVRVLVQAAPEHLDLEKLTAELSDVAGVINVHDLHAWTLTSDMDVATVHVMTANDVDPHPVLDQARTILERHGIAHATLQVEPESHRGCAELSW